jgi:hypothetical protein
MNEVLLIEHKTHAKYCEERNREIVRLWSEEDKSPQEIGEIYRLTEVRIYQILRENHIFIKMDKDWERKKAIQQVRKMVAQASPSKKDVSDLIMQLLELVNADGKPKDFQTNNIQFVLINAPNISGQAQRGSSERVYLDAEAREMFTKQGS